LASSMRAATSDGTTGTCLLACNLVHISAGLLREALQGTPPRVLIEGLQMASEIAECTVRGLARDMVDEHRRSAASIAVQPKLGSAVSGAVVEALALEQLPGCHVGWMYSVGLPPSCVTRAGCAVVQLAQGAQWTGPPVWPRVTVLCCTAPIDRMPQLPPGPLLVLCAAAASLDQRPGVKLLAQLDRQQLIQVAASLGTPLLDQIHGWVDSGPLVEARAELVDHSLLLLKSVGNQQQQDADEQWLVVHVTSGSCGAAAAVESGRCAMAAEQLVPGGGVPELAAAAAIELAAHEHGGAEGIAMKAFAQALNSLTLALAHNNGLNGAATLAQLRSAHADPQPDFPVHLGVGPSGVCDMTQAAVFEPLESRIKAIRLATETAVMILNIEFVTSSLFKPTESTPSETTM